jgi:hypothetical protein
MWLHRVWQAMAAFDHWAVHPRQLLPSEVYDDTLIRDVPEPVRDHRGAIMPDAPPLPALPREWVQPRQLMDHFELAQHLHRYGRWLGYNR